MPGSPWRDVWLGALIAAVRFELGKFILGFYFGRSASLSSYGPAGSLIIILVLVFYSAQILFFAAEFTVSMPCATARTSPRSPTQ